MYTQVIASALGNTDLSDNTVKALMSVFGNCSLPLTHRAPITTEVPTNESTSITYQDFLDNIVNNIDNHTDNYFSYAFSPQLYSTVNNVTNNIDGGLNIYAPGVSYLQEILTSGLYIDPGDITWTNTAGELYCFEEKRVVTDVRLSYTFDSATCTLTLTLAVDKDYCSHKIDCPDDDTTISGASRSSGSSPSSGDSSTPQFQTPYFPFHPGPPGPPGTGIGM